MDTETVKKLGGTVSKLVVSYSRKLGDKQFGSEGASFGVEVDVPAGVDIKELGDAYYEFLKEAAKRNLAPAMKERLEGKTAVAAATDVLSQHAANVALAAAEVTDAAAMRAVGPAAPEIQRTPTDDEGNEYEVIDVSLLVVQFTPTGKKVGKIKGGPYTKIGVTVWPEVLKPLGVDIEPLAAGEYTPAELLGKKARCLMKISDKSGKPYPEKVVAFV